MSENPSAEQMEHLKNPATRVELVGAILALENRVTSLASALIAMKADDTEGFFSAMKEYFDARFDVMTSVNELMHRESTDE